MPILFNPHLFREPALHRPVQQHYIPGTQQHSNQQYWKQRAPAPPPPAPVTLKTHPAPVRGVAPGRGVATGRGVAPGRCGVAPGRGGVASPTSHNSPVAPITGQYQTTAAAVSTLKCNLS